MKVHPFFVRYGKNARSCGSFAHKIQRTWLKEDIYQIRDIAVAGFRELSVEIDRDSFIESIPTGREVRYRLKATVIEPIKHIEY